MPSTVRPLSVVPAPDPTQATVDVAPGSDSGRGVAAPGSGRADRPAAARPDADRPDAARRPAAGPAARPRRAAARPTAAAGATSALQFSEAVRTVIAVAHRHRLRPPVFRSPPALDGVDRTIRRRAGGADVVAVRRAGRPVAAVRADVVEGIVAANRLAGAEADRFRHDAWAALDPTTSRRDAVGPALERRDDRSGPGRREPVAAEPSGLDEVA